MTRLTTALLSFLLVASACTSKPSGDTDDSSGTTLIIDSTLVSMSGADDYGMKRYIMAFLRRGPVRNHDSAAAAAIQRAHLDNIKRMADEGFLILAGPFLDDNDIRGIYLFNVESIDEARALTETDPAIQSGRLVMELRPWYGSAALLKVNDIHKAFWEKEI